MIGTFDGGRHSIAIEEITLPTSPLARTHSETGCGAHAVVVLQPRSSSGVPSAQRTKRPRTKVRTQGLIVGSAGVCHTTASPEVMPHVKPGPLRTRLVPSSRHMTAGERASTTRAPGQSSRYASQSL